MNACCIQPCIQSYKRASLDCDQIVNSCGFSDDREKRFSYTKTMRGHSFLFLGAGSCCLLGGVKVASYCCIPGAIACASTEIPVCAICVLNVASQRFRGKEHNNVDVVTSDTPQPREMSEKDKLQIPVGLDLT